MHLKTRMLLTSQLYVQEASFTPFGSLLGLLWAVCWRPREASKTCKRQEASKSAPRGLPLPWKPPDQAYLRAPRGLQMGEGISGLAPLGRHLGHFWCYNAFLTPENEPTAPPKDQTLFKTGPKSVKNGPQGLQKYLKMAPTGVLIKYISTDMALRTARSD